MTSNLKVNLRNQRKNQKGTNTNKKIRTMKNFKIAFQKSRKNSNNWNQTPGKNTKRKIPEWMRIRMFLNKTRKIKEETQDKNQKNQEE